MSEIFFQGFWRMDWGLGNPNKTAALIAILMVAVWSLAYLRNRLFWVSLVLFSALGICLVHTFSRGGMVAAFCGLIPLLVCLRRPLPMKRIVGVVAAFWLIIGASIYLQAHERYGQGVVQEDRSISNRFVLWKAAPTMMVDAPGGWGFGQSGKAYMDWYQPLDRNESYSNSLSR
ncbi:MAG: O-antigen ligase family protein [Verrucomicrobia bacterium]|nr:O-antigen ligase family protein [Verrucomicrobiota bacterium]